MPSPPRSATGNADWRPQSNDRFFLVGPTRKGKTVRARLLASWWRDVPGLLVLWLDPKLAEGLRDIPQLELGAIPAAEGEWRIVLPAADYAAEPVCEAVWRRGNTLLVVDELPLVATERKIGRWFRACYQQGAELGIGVVALTQDPVSVPRVCRTQAEHFLVWPIRAPDYVALMAESAHQDPAELGRLLAGLAPYECVLCSDRLPAMQVLPADLG